MERPPVAFAGSLGDPQAIRAVVPAPNQRGGNRDACEIVRRDPRDPEFTQQATGSLRVGSTGPFEAIGKERLPALAQLVTQAIEIERALPHECGCTCARSGAPEMPAS